MRLRAHFLSLIGQQSVEKFAKANFWRTGDPTDLFGSSGGRKQQRTAGGVSGDKAFFAEASSVAKAIDWSLLGFAEDDTNWRLLDIHDARCCLRRPRAPSIYKISIYWKCVLYERTTVKLHKPQEGTVSRCWQKVSSSFPFQLILSGILVLMNVEIQRTVEHLSRWMPLAP